MLVTMLQTQLFRSIVIAVAFPIRKPVIHLVVFDFYKQVKIMEAICQIIKRKGHNFFRTNPRIVIGVFGFSIKQVPTIAEGEESKAPARSGSLLPLCPMPKYC